MPAASTAWHEGSREMDVREGITIPDEELTWTFARSGGPGGQNVNKVASKAQLRWKAVGSSALPEPVMARLLAQHRNRLTLDGELLITSQIHRDQDRNRQACVDKLAEMVEAALRPPTPRRRTKPTRASKERRLESKKRRSEVKEGRRSVD